MNLSTTSLTKTWRNQWVVFSLFITTTYFTVHFTLTRILDIQFTRLHFEHSVAFMVEIGFPDSLDFVGFDFQHNILNSTKLYNSARFESIALRSVILDWILPVNFVETVRVVLFFFHFRLQLEDSFVLSFIYYNWTYQSKAWINFSFIWFFL